MTKLALISLLALSLAPPFAMAKKDKTAKTTAAKTITTKDGLQYQDLVVGKGETAVAKKQVTVNYTGTLTNGKVFDTSEGPGREPFTFQLGVGQVIKGWDEGVVGMKVGGKRHLLIPADLAYGKKGAGDAIPPNSPLAFDVEVLKVE